MQTIYILNEVYDDQRCFSTVFSSHEDALNRVKHLLDKFFTSYIYEGNNRWFAYFKRETALRTTVSRTIITIEQFNYLPRHDEWVNVN